MSLSVVSVAMQLSGLEAHYFTSGDDRLRWLYEDGARRLYTSSPALSTTSTTSTASSSGFNSWASDIQMAKEDVTLVNSKLVRANSIPIEKAEGQEMKVMYNGRDILDLKSNLMNTEWNLNYSQLPRDPLHFFSNRSQYSRVNNNMMPPHKTETCPHCGFVTSIFD